MRRPLLAWIIGTVVVCLGALAAVIAAGYAPSLGLDLQGGASVVYQPAHPVPEDQLNQAIAIIRNRVDALGVSEPNIARQGNNIVIQLPGVKDQQRALQIVGQTAQLFFRPVLCTAPPYTPPAPGTPPPPAGPPQCSPSASAGQPDPALASVASTPKGSDTSQANVLLPEKGSTIRYVLGPAILNGSIIKNATAALPQNGGGGWQVNFTLTSSGSPKFDQLAQQNYQKQVAIELDGIVQSAPTINAQSFNGQGQITGSFNESSAKNLALVLRYGALPVQLNQQTATTVSPTLGRDSLHAGLVAGLVGLGLVMLYMVAYYRALGLVVIAGLALTAALLWVIVSYLSHTSGLALDLSGVIGIIVSIGIAVDSYVVYFERLKDEIRSGKTIRSSVDRGFKSAFRTVLAADAVSGIGALILWWRSVGAVRGFAFYLLISTALDVVITYTFTRPMVIMLGRNRIFTEARWLGVARGLASAPTEAKTERPAKRPAETPV
ncbi:MAG TPA: protein translocase subunit SecD [Acidimicrobiales bacterium]|nr:protein translocase subunit SecD [Acidimicrobiales bacterium]